MANYGDYTQPNEWQLNNLHTAMDWNAAALPALRVLGGDTQWSINISAGNVTGVDYIEKFGLNNDVDSEKETIWDGGGIYEYLSAPDTVVINSTDPSDSATGSGARTVEVQGLDAGHNMVTEILTVGGGPGAQLFIRVFRAIVITAGTSGVNEGTLTIMGNNSGLLLAGIGVDGQGQKAAGRGQTFMALYTIPAGKTGFLTQWTVGAGKQNTDAISFLMVKQPGIANGAFNSKDVITVSATTYSKNYKIPLRFNELTDIEVRAYSTTNNSLVSSTFNIILVDNENIS